MIGLRLELETTRRNKLTKLRSKTAERGDWYERGPARSEEEVQFLALFPSGSSVSSRILPLPGSSPRGRQGWCVNPGSGPGGGGELQGSCPSLESFPGVHLQLPPGFSSLRLPTLLLSLSHGSISGLGVTSPHKLTWAGGYHCFRANF